METQFETIVTKRDASHERALFKKGTQVTIDTEEMMAYEACWMACKWHILQTE